MTFTLPFQSSLLFKVKLLPVIFIVPFVAILTAVSALIVPFETVIDEESEVVPIFRVPPEILSAELFKSNPEPVTFVVPPV